MTAIERLRRFSAAALFAAFALLWAASYEGAFAQFPTNPLGPATGFNATIESYFYGDVPVTVSALSGCVTGGTPALSGTQKFMRVTGGSTAQTTCTITWPVPRSVAPSCVIQGETVALSTQSVNNTTTLTWTFASTASTVWNIACQGPR